MAISQVFAVLANVSRGDTYGTLTGIAGLADAIARRGWQETSVMLVSDEPQGDIANTVSILTGMVEGMKDNAKLVIGDKAYAKSQILEALESVDTTTQAPAIVAGNRRALALCLLFALGVSVKPKTAIAKGDVRLANITENSAHEYALRLDRASKLASVRAIADSLSCEADIGKLGFKRGMSQWLWQALRLTSQGEADSIILQGDKMSLKSLADATQEEKETQRQAIANKAPAPKTMAGKDILAEAHRLPEGDSLRAILEAIATCQPLTVGSLVTAHLAKADK